MDLRQLAIPVVLAGHVLAPGSAAAVEVAYDFGIYSHYTWRGISLTDDPVVQPSVLLSHRNGFSVELWGNLDAGPDNDNQGELNEIRVTLQYAWQLEHVEIAVGAIDYTFPNTPFAGTWEVYASVGSRGTRSRGAVSRGTVAPRLTVYYDVDEVEDVYADLAVDLHRPLSSLWRATLTVSVGYAGADFAIGGRAGLHDGNVRLAFAYAGRVAVRILGGYTRSLDARVLVEQPVGAWGGVQLGIDF